MSLPTRKNPFRADEPSEPVQPLELSPWQEAKRGAKFAARWGGLIVGAIGLLVWLGILGLFIYKWFRHGNVVLPYLIEKMGGLWGFAEGIGSALAVVAISAALCGTAGGSIHFVAARLRQRKRLSQEVDPTAEK